MRRGWVGSAIAVLALLLRAGVAGAQAPASDPVGGLPGGGVVRPPRQGVREPYPMPAATTYGVLDEMASRASVIFVGSVVAVRWPVGGDAAAGVVSVEFKVEESILGPGAGTTYVVREWAGLWRDAARYRVGQRRLMLLYGPGPGGLSSPVDGLDGAIPVTGGDGGDAPANARAGNPAAALPVLRADLRWLQAKQLRVVTLAGEPGGRPAQQVADPLAGNGGGPSSQASSVVVAHPPLVEVTGRLRAGGGLSRAGR